MSDTQDGIQTCTIGDVFPVLRNEAKELIGNLEQMSEEGEWEDEDQEGDTENALTAMQQISKLPDCPYQFGNITYEFRWARWDNPLDNAKDIAHEFYTIACKLHDYDGEWVDEVKSANEYCTGIY